MAREVSETASALVESDEALGLFFFFFGGVVFSVFFCLMCFFEYSAWCSILFGLDFFKAFIKVFVCSNRVL